MRTGLLLIFCFSLQLCCAQLSGTYIIGGTDGVDPPDFKHFGQALEALQKGVTGPVTFKIKPGVYDGGIHLEYIPGTNAVNRIVFESFNGDSSSVVIKYGGGTNTGTVQLNGTQFITFRNLTLENNNTVSYHDDHVFQITNPYEVRVENCRIISTNTTGNSLDHNSSVVVKFNWEGMVGNCYIDKCSIESGVFGVNVSGPNGEFVLSNCRINSKEESSVFTSWTEKVDILSCVMSGAIKNDFGGGHFDIINNIIHGYVDIALGYLEGNVIGDSTSQPNHLTNVFYVVGNTIYNKVTASNNVNYFRKNKYIRNLDLTSFNNVVEITDNVIDTIHCDDGTGVKIERNHFLKNTYFGSDGTASSTFVNNFVYGKADIGYVYNWTIAYNNFLTTQFELVTSQNNVYNNNFFKDFAFTPATGYVRDYNNYYPQTNIIESHSFHINPQYVSPDDLHIQNPDLHGLDTLIYNLNADVDGDVRSGHSAIGADAVCFPTQFSAGPDFTIECGDSIVPEATICNQANYKWWSTASIDTLSGALPEMAPYTSQTFYVSANDLCGQQYSDSFFVEVTPFELEATGETMPDCGLPFLLSATYSPAFQYAWQPSSLVYDSLSYQTLAATNETATFIATASHPICGISADTIVIAPDSNAVADFSVLVYSNLADFVNESTFPAWYYWDFGDGTQSNLLDPSHAYTVNAWYNVTLIVVNSCGGADTVSEWINYNSVGIFDPEESSEIIIRVYPNPIQSMGIIEIQNSIDNAGEMTIFNYLGNEIFRRKFDLHSSRQIPVDWDDQPAGVYFIQMVFGEGCMAHQSFIKQ